MKQPVALLSGLLVGHYCAWLEQLQCLAYVASETPAHIYAVHRQRLAALAPLPAVVGQQYYCVALVAYHLVVCGKVAVGIVTANDMGSVEAVGSTEGGEVCCAYSSCRIAYHPRLSAA